MKIVVNASVMIRLTTTIYFFGVCWRCCFRGWAGGGGLDSVVTSNQSEWWRMMKRFRNNQNLQVREMEVFGTTYWYSAKFILDHEIWLAHPGKWTSRASKYLQLFGDDSSRSSLCLEPNSVPLWVQFHEHEQLSGRRTIRLWACPTLLLLKADRPLPL